MEVIMLALTPIGRLTIWSIVGVSAIMFAALVIEMF
jgi:hypothetical protein